MRKIYFLLIFGITVSCCRNNNEEYLYGVPPEPPYFEAEATVTNEVTLGCSSQKENIIVYLISYEENNRNEFELIVQDMNGVRRTCFLEKDEMSNADRSWLPSILIPGNKIEMKIQLCGNGGYTYIMKLKNLKRNG